MTIGDKIKKIRKAKNLTQTELARLCGLKEESGSIMISQYESGKRIPKDKTLATIADALGVSPYYLKSASFSDNDAFVHYLYELETQCHITISKTENDDIVLTFPHDLADNWTLALNSLEKFDDPDYNSVKNKLGNIANVYGSLLRSLDKWYDKKQELENGNINSIEYDQWKSKNPKQEKP